MKVTPLLHFDPELLAEIEAVLQEGETASVFIETSVRSAVEFRRLQTSFHERGEAAWHHYQRTGVFQCPQSKFWQGFKQRWTPNESSLADDRRHPHDAERLLT